MADSEPSLFFVPSATRNIPAFTSARAALSPLTWNSVVPVVLIVTVAPARSLTVMVVPLIAVTSPPAWGRITVTESIEYEPSVSCVWRKPISSPTLRSPSATVSPLFEYVVPLSTVIVRVQPSAVFSEMLLPEVAVIVIPPKPWPKPRSPGPPIPLRSSTMGVVLVPVVPAARVPVGDAPAPKARMPTAISAATAIPRRPIRAQGSGSARRATAAVWTGSGSVMKSSIVSPLLRPPAGSRRSVVEHDPFGP